MDLSYPVILHTMLSYHTSFGGKEREKVDTHHMQIQTFVFVFVVVFVGNIIGGW